MAGLEGWHLLILLTVLSDAQQLNGPIITSPREIILNKGDNFTIYCKGKSPLEFKQQEMAEEVTGNFTKTQRNVAPSDAEYSYEIALDLYNVDQFAVGYYACLDARGEAPRGLAREPADSDHVSYTYVYVNHDTELIVPMREIVFVTPGSSVVIECKPTSPDVQINLNVKTEQKGNKKPEIRVLRNSTKIGFFVKVSKSYTYVCEGRRGKTYQNKSAHIHLRKPFPNVDSKAARLKIYAQKYFLEGETFILNCTFPYSMNTMSYSAVSLQWVIPRGNFEDVDIISNENQIISVTLYRAIRVKNARRTDEGIYSCSAETNAKDKQVRNVSLKFTPTPLLELQPGKSFTADSSEFKLLFEIKEQHPPAEFKIFNDKHIQLKNSSKYEITTTPITRDVELLFRDVTVEDIGNYTLEATNANGTKTSTNVLIVKDIPRITFEMSNERKLKGTEAILICEATGYPLPTVQWTFIDDETQTETPPTPGIIKFSSIYKVVSKLKMPVTTPGAIVCKASNDEAVSNVTKEFRVNEIPNGFGVENGEEGIKWASQNEQVTLKCLASKYDYMSVDWLGPNDVLPPNMVESYNNSMSHIAVLRIDQISLSQTGNYTCIGYDQTGEKQRETILIKVEASRPLYIKDWGLDETKEVIYNQPVELVCIAEAVPPPTIEWYKINSEDNQKIEKSIYTSIVNFTKIQSVYNFTKRDNGVDEFECVATSLDNVLTKHFSVSFPKSTLKTEYLGIIGAIIFALIILVAYLTWKIRKEKQFRKELNAAGLLYFNEGAVKSLNPNLPIDEQADLLPYNDKFEFPAEKLILGPQLGAGAFGVVYKAEARGIINAEDSTTVAVKMVKKTADNIYIKALASELKIMANLGQHVNIVNLLGACTKNVAKRELIVIVEYCKFGNIHNYMQRHREVFIDQLTDNREKHQGNVNRAFSYSSGNSGMNSDCFNSNQTQQTDHTFLSTAASTKPGRIEKFKPKLDSEKVSESGYVQPEWRSNYESDYVYNGRQPRPLTSRDLLAWAFQIARGMEYLASRKILHGDLAARNILLTEDNIVKICDFGLARSIYKNDEYQKKENSPLPIKWLALECITDRIFSTQSDVWSFGIVLWELFSLAKSPYPEISPRDLPLRLQQGHRMDKPMYADDRLYDVMRSCWEVRPPKRPSFTELQKILGSFLEDNVRDHYVELNAPCETTNAGNTGEDYLMRVCAPDFTAQVTPSPHHYSNDAGGFFFGSNPSRLQNDDDGYLAMTPSNQNVRSPRHANAFDFEARALNTRGSASSQGCELTPMLTLSHIPRSGSESDQEGGASPYLNMQPRIDEETDEVFEIEIKNNLKNAQNNAVTNPTYITVPLFEKKPQINGNNYINVNGNGLVK